MSDETKTVKDLMDPEVQDRLWLGLKANIAMHQDGGGGWPTTFLMEKLRETVVISALRFGGEDYGYFFWLRPQTGSIRSGMRQLIGCFADFDDEVGLRLAAQARVKELEAKFEDMMARAGERAHKVVASRPKVEKVSSNEDHGGDVGSKGRQAYERRSAGEPWQAIGPHAVNSAKSHAKTNGLPWPPVWGAIPPSVGGASEDTTDRRGARSANH